jgi:hypothetical protein
MLDSDLPIRPVLESLARVKWFKSNNVLESGISYSVHMLFAPIFRGIDLEMDSLGETTFLEIPDLTAKDVVWYCMLKYEERFDVRDWDWHLRGSLAARDLQD